LNLRERCRKLVDLQHLGYLSATICCWMLLRVVICCSGQPLFPPFQAYGAESFPLAPQYIAYAAVASARQNPPAPVFGGLLNNQK
jgi:cytochrome c oxidase assembly factor CtaG